LCARRLWPAARGAGRDLKKSAKKAELVAALKVGQYSLIL
jgi:hypothetical protein